MNDQYEFDNASLESYKGSFHGAQGVNVPVAAGSKVQVKGAGSDAAGVLRQGRNIDVEDGTLGSVHGYSGVATTTDGGGTVDEDPSDDWKGAAKKGAGEGLSVFFGDLWGEEEPSPQPGPYSGGYPAQDHEPKTRIMGMSKGTALFVGGLLLAGGIFAGYRYFKGEGASTPQKTK